jgi:hypothetical protein
MPKTTALTTSECVDPEFKNVALPALRAALLFQSKPVPQAGSSGDHEPAFATTVTHLNPSQRFWFQDD